MGVLINQLFHLHWLPGYEIVIANLVLCALLAIYNLLSNACSRNKLLLIILQGPDVLIRFNKWIIHYSLRILD